jgi:hypothetical protein
MNAANPRACSQTNYDEKFAKYPEVKLLKNATNRKRIVERSIRIWTARLADWTAEVQTLEIEIENLTPVVKQIRLANRRAA